MPAKVIVTGASGNLGKDVVRKLSELGYALHLTLRAGEESSFDGMAHVQGEAVNLLDRDAAANFVTNITGQAEPVKAGIFLVGAYAPGKIADTDAADIEKMISVNFFTAFHLVQPLLKHFEDNGGGQFIFIGARPALEAAQGAANFAYTLSKSLLFKMAEMINAEGKTKNITATMIVPSTMDTPDTRAAMPEADFTKWVPTADVADTIAFVLSDPGKKMRESVLKIYNRS